MISKQRILLTEDDRAVPDGDPEGVKLLVGEGCDISVEDAEKYGLVDHEGAPVVAPEPVATEGVVSLPAPKVAAVPPPGPQGQQGATVQQGAPAQPVAAEPEAGS